MATASPAVDDLDWHVADTRLRLRVGLDRWVKWLLPLLFLAVLYPIFDMLYWIGQKALPTLTITILTTNPSGFGGGLYAPILGTFYILAIATSIATVIGVLSGIYTAEIAGPRLAEAARVGGNLLAGTPAIVVGYFGYFLLLIDTHSQPTLLAGAVTLSIFIVPYIYRTSDMAFASVPPDQKEAAMGMGTTRWQYLRRVAFPIALPRVLTGVFVAMAIGMGETAPLLFTAGWSNFPAISVTGPTSYLTGVIWLFYQFPSNEGTDQTLAFQAAFLLILMVIVLNIVVQIISERYRRRLRGIYR